MMTVSSYQNPILRGMHPDPSVVRVEDTFYMVHSTFEYYPGIALSKSTDLLNWTKLPSIATKTTQADLRASKSNEGIFAACIRYYDGHFYVITTNFAEFKNFIIKGTLHPNGEAIIWEEDRVVVDIMGIDPDLYFEDGKVYVQFTGYIDDKGTKAIQQVEIHLETGAILRGPEVLSFGTGGRDVEGPHILKQKGYYYLLAAEGGTGVGHMITMFRSKSLWGPFESAPQNPLFTNRDRAEEPLQNIGHADLFQDSADNWWLTCLGTRPASLGFTRITNIGRETLLYPVDWSGEWPVMYHGIPHLAVDLSDFPEHAKVLRPQQIIPFIDTFQDSTLSPEWVSLRDSLKERFILENGRLTLIGSNTTLCKEATPSFLALRQTEHNEQFIVHLDKKTSQAEHGRIGVSIVIDARHHASLLLQKDETGYAVYKQLTILDVVIDEQVGHLPQFPDTLRLTHTPDSKTFCAQAGDECISFSLHAQHFSNEAIAALNTGNFAGLYALGQSAISVTKVERIPFI